MVLSGTLGPSHKILTRPPTDNHPRPPSSPVPILYSSLSPRPGDDNPLHHPIAPLLSAAWFKPKDTVLPSCTLAAFLPHDEDHARRYADALHALANGGVPYHKHPHFQYFQPGILPSSLIPFLCVQAGISMGNMPEILAALAATSIRRYHRAELFKHSVTAGLLTDMGFPKPSFDPHPMGIVSPS